MPTSLTLSSPATVAWAGSTASWVNVANAIADDGSYASATALLAGSKTEYIRCVIDAPGSPFAVLPSTLTLTVNAWISSADAYFTDVADVVAQLGTAAGPLGTNATAGTLLTTNTGAYYTFSLPTDGITLGQLNAGTARVFLAYQAIPTVSTIFNVGNWSVVITPTSPQTAFGVPTVSLTTNFLVTATYTGGGSAPNYVVLSFTGSSTGTGDSGMFAESYTGTTTLSDGLGGTASGGIESPAATDPASRAASTTAKQRLTVSGGIATTTITMTGTVTFSAYGAGNQCEVVHALTATVVQPTSSEARVDAMSLMAPDTIISPGAIQMLVTDAVLGRVPQLQVGVSQI